MSSSSLILITLISSFTTFVIGSAIRGDPQFVGFHGQSYQVHGYPEAWFNIITSPTLDMNSRFTYLASGECTYNNTQCWTHPGTYMNAFGITVPMIGNDIHHNNATGSVAQLSISAGTHEAGLTVTVNSHAFPIGTVASFPSGASISHPSYDTVLLSTGPFEIKFVNADDFMNIETKLAINIVKAGAKKVDMKTEHTCQKGAYPELPIHGLLGQTWRNAVYAAGRAYEGSVDDYVCSAQFTYDSVFNLKIANAKAGDAQE